MVTTDGTPSAATKQTTAAAIATTPAPRSLARTASRAQTQIAATIRPGSRTGTSCRLAHGWSGMVWGSHSTATACFVAALAVPPVVTTFGIGAKPVTPPAAYPASAAPAFQRTSVGELGAITNLCGAIPGNSPVILLDQVAARRFTQVIRGMCGIPAGVMVGETPAQLQAVVGEIMRTGHRAVLLATHPAELAPYGGAPRQVVNLTTIEDAHVLTQPPASGWPVHYVLWMSGPGAAGGAQNGT